MKMEQYGVIELASHPAAPNTGTVIVYCLSSDKNIYSKDSGGVVRQLTNVTEEEEPIVTDAVAFKVTGSGTSSSIAAGTQYEPPWDTVIFDTEGTFNSPFVEYYGIPVTGIYSVGVFAEASTSHAFSTGINVYDELGNNIESYLMNRPGITIGSHRGTMLLYLEAGWSIAATITNNTGVAQTYEEADSEFYGFLVK